MSDAPRFNLPGMLAALYGIRNPVSYPAAMAEAERAAPEMNYLGITIVPDDAVVAQSSIGTPVLLPITFKGSATYKGYGSDGRVVEVPLGDLRLPVTCVCEMSREKNITTTQVSAAHGSVKEVFSYADWSVRISGIITDEKNQPQQATTVEEMEARILEFDNLADSIEVESLMLNRRGVHRLCLRSVSFSQIPGKPRMLGFQMDCESDAPLELLIHV